MTTVRQHERRSPEKSPAYIKTHTALFPRRADAAAFLERHNVPIVTTDDPRLAVPPADPVPGPASMPIEQHKSLLRQIAELVRGK